MLIGRDISCLLVVDIQEKLLPAMQDPMLVVCDIGVLMQAAATLGVPVLVSEQYPQGLGRRWRSCGTWRRRSRSWRRRRFPAPTIPGCGEGSWSSIGRR